VTAIDDLIDQLKDGEWHNLQDLAKSLKLTPKNLNEIIQFLKNLDLIKLDKTQQKTQLNTDLKQLITQEA
jgi:DNA-binding IclR family transcriptional regulator